MSDEKLKPPGKHSKKINVAAVVMAIASPVGMYFTAVANADNSVERSEKNRVNENSVVVDMMRDRLDRQQRDIDSCHSDLKATKAWAEKEFGKAHEHLHDHDHRRTMVTETSPEEPSSAPVKHRPAKAEPLPAYDVVQQMAD